jgi:ATP-dependent DNA helicase RecG
LRGRGIDTIYEGQLRYGRDAPDWSHSTGGSVQVVLPGGPANVAMARFILERDTPGRRVSVDEMLILNAMSRERRMDAPRAAVLMQRSESSAQSVLDRLVQGGVLELRQERRERVYDFSESVREALGATAEAPRARGGADDAQREQLIMRWVEGHGRITRSQAADLFQVEGREARAVLERLVKRGELIVRGERRGSYYERPAEVGGAG